MNNFTGGVKQKILFLAGMPASGKTTISYKLEEMFGFKHISAGECLREEMEDSNSQYSSLIRSYIDRGDIVPGHITLSLMKKKINSFGWGKTVVTIDGFPRNLDNVQCWVKEMSDIVEVINLICLVCSEDTIKDRLKLRTTEMGTLHYPKRSDDNLSVLANRLKVFHDQTEPVVLCFTAASKCLTINADVSREELWDKVDQYVQSLGYKHVK
ncbi:Adenylate kinase family protein [Theileria parva strain Muguga]|uniref:UMP-CMP kinase, putative n=1 Tax=Theileria parva TaxID=5875 RepID=Q4N4F0_THEPA|nr:Adenylate kinase family protein [Theileria parva strain Muguga]EAN32973.1 Adenylate kinase family protein [Theileria parva strain Muguga]|eukprot:XP_765256.1 UMP-CMP kinase [Theileria parva strain Muguga]